MDKESIRSNLYQPKSSIAHLENIEILNRVRLIVILGQAFLIFIAEYLLDIRLPITILARLLAGEILFQTYSLSSVKNRENFTAFEVFSHILFDSLVIALLIYLTGGANNPFSYLLLLPVALSSFMLSSRYLIAITVIQLILYSLLHLYQKPLFIGSASPIESFHFHMAGMWMNFSFTVVLIAVFGLITRRAIMKQDKRLQALREKSLQEEQILSLAIMSASAAHELNTPLATMSIIIDDWYHANLSSEQKDEIETLKGALNKCKQSIQALNRKSEQVRIQLGEAEAEAKDARLFKDKFEMILEQWLIYRPQITLSKNWSSDIENYQHPIDISLGQALTNLLDNSAEASLKNQSNQIALKVELSDEQLIIDILDEGKGISTSKVGRLGSRIQKSDKNNGLGWGMFLSNVTIERLGGSVQLLESKSAGTITRVILPRWNNHG